MEKCSAMVNQCPGGAGFGYFASAGGIVCKSADSCLSGCSTEDPPEPRILPAFTDLSFRELNGPLPKATQFDRNKLGLIPVFLLPLIPKL